jgi:hypothetical protein
VRTPRKTALGALAATAVALLTPMTSASADQGDTLKGGCGVNANVIYVAAFSQEASGTPSTATVSCWIDVDGVEQPDTRLTSTANGLVAGERQIVYTAAESGVARVCQQVTFADGSTWTARDGNVGTDCQPAATVAVTSPDSFDSVLCPLFIALYAETDGGILGVLRIHSDGDLYVAQPLGVGYIRVYDCPPHGN